MAFQALAIEGSKQYYAYLDQCGKGVVSIDVLKVSCVEDSALFDLTLGQIPFNPDGLQVKICHDTFEYNDIHAVELTRASRILRVRTSASAKAKLLCADPNDVKVISDVKFLVKRVEDWYRQYGDRVRIPTEHPAVSAYMKTGLQAPSSDQSTAIEGALSNPFTYIWGAPGTGKTKFVLSRCVLSYLKAGKRILIAAPTNNAVEQTLYGVLDVFEEAGIDYKGKLLRLGMASAAFAGKYPDACEDRVQIKLLASLTSQLQTVSNVLSSVCPCGVVAFRPEQHQKFLTVSGAAHTLVDHAHQFELPALTFRCRVVFRVGHSARLPLLVFLKFRQSQFFTDLVVANAQLLNLLVRHMHLPPGFKIHAVDGAVRVDVFTVGVRADQHLAALEISGKLPCCFVRCARINVRTFREALHHVIEHHAAVLVVQQLCTQEFVERRFRLAADPADELLTVPKRLAELGNIAHDTFHAAARLRTLFVVHEMDDCDFATPPSCNSRRAMLILENSCAAESKLANWTFPMFASTASWLRLLPMAFCCRRTSLSPFRITIRFPRQHAVT